MIDSTYTNACDPNSMKDQGLPRNAIYNVAIEQDPSVIPEPDTNSNYFRTITTPHRNRN